MLSLILCTLGDRENDIRRLLDSLVSQTYKNFEMILVTQGYHDKIGSLIKEYDFKHTHIISRISGLSKARNLAMQAMHGEHFTLVDDDCWYPDHAFEQAVNFLDNSDADAVEFQYADSITGKPSRKYGEQPVANISKRQLVSATSLGLFIKSAAVSSLSFDDRFGAGSIYNSGEEAIFLNELRKKGKKIAYVPLVVSYHPIKGRQQYLKGRNIIAKGAIFGRIFPKAAAPLVFLFFCLKNHRYVSWKYVPAGFMRSIHIPLYPTKPSGQKSVKITFICHTLYHLQTSFLYARHLQEHLSENIEYELFWMAKNTFLLDSFRPYFTRLTVYDTNFGSLKMLKTVLALHGTGRMFGKLLITCRKLLLVSFIDQNVYNRQIISMSCKHPDCRVIQLEDGAGIYTSASYWTPPIRILFMKLVGIPGPYNIDNGENPSVDVIIAKRPVLIPAEKKANKAVFRQTVDLGSDEYGKELCSMFHSGEALALARNSDILYVGQPLEEQGIPPRTQTHMLLQIFKCIPTRYRILIKPHPREGLDKYSELLITYKNITILQDDASVKTPVEIIYLNSDTFMLTPFSSAGINVSNMYGHRKVIFLCKLFGLDKFTPYIEKLTNNRCDIPGTFDELVRILDAGVEKREKHGYNISNKFSNRADLNYLFSELNKG